VDVAEVRGRILRYLLRHPSVGYLRLLEDVLGVPPYEPESEEEAEERRKLFRLGLQALRSLEEGGVVEFAGGVVNLRSWLEGEWSEEQRRRAAAQLTLDRIFAGER